jgi:hypothetical protein
MGQTQNHGTARGTVIGQHYGQALAALRSNRPELIEREQWQQAIRDAETFLVTYEETAHALGWTARPAPRSSTAPGCLSATIALRRYWIDLALGWLRRNRLSRRQSGMKAMREATAVIIGIFPCL